jgi:hypothetical protein
MKQSRVSARYQAETARGAAMTVDELASALLRAIDDYDAIRDRSR